MKDRVILKASIVISIIGMIALFTILNITGPKEIDLENIEEAMEGDILKLKGTIIEEKIIKT
jgi:hypothetical protein